MDRLVSNLEAVLMPELERRRSCLADDMRFTEARIVSLRHADVIHTIGLTCHPVSAATEEDSYCVHVNIIGISGISVRGFVGWYQPFILDRLLGHTIYKAMTIPYRLASAEQLDPFLALMPALLQGFERGLRRGHPPSTLRQLWNRIFFGMG